jgi:hypothetical protein
MNQILISDDINRIFLYGTEFLILFTHADYQIKKFRTSHPYIFGFGHLLLRVC